MKDEDDMKTKAAVTGELLSDLLTSTKDARFRVQDGDYIEGDIAALEIIPLPVRGSGRFNLDISVVPYAPAADVPQAVLEGGREAFIAALDDPDPRIVAEAKQRLADLDRPHADLGELAETLFFVDVLDENGESAQSSYPAFFDGKGRAHVR